MQEDIVQIGVKRHLQHKPERLFLVLSVYYTCNVVKRLKMGWLYAPVSLDSALFIIYLSYFHRLHCTAKRVKFELIQTDLKAYLIIYDMKQSHPLMQSTLKKFIIQEKHLSGWFLFMEVNLASEEKQTGWVSGKFKLQATVDFISAADKLRGNYLCYFNRVLTRLV